MSDKYAQWVRDRQVVEAHYAYGREGTSVHARGKVVAYCDAPTVVIQTEDGTRVHWRADLTVEAPDDPRRDVPGAVRVSNGGALYMKVEARGGVDPWVFVCGGAGAAVQFPRMSDGAVIDWPHATPVPGTPAGDVEQAEIEHTDCFEPEPVTGAEIDAWARAEACTASECATGIDCALTRFHPLDMDHEGTHVPNQSIGYPLFVRWPWQQYDRDYSGAAGVLAEDAPPLPDAYPHYYQPDDDSGQWWRIDALDGPVMWRRHERANWVESSIRTEEALVAMLGGHVHRCHSGEVTS